jgi:DeoR/GlpR family transcriptional regulator of sugar metabolism
MSPSNKAAERSGSQPLPVEDRRALIQQRVMDEGRIDYGTLAAFHEVSEMTIRRDIEVLESRGAVRRVLGGAIAFTGKAEEPAFEARALQAAHEKAHIAAAAAALLGRHETVIFDGGSTALAVARAVRGRGLGLTVITPSVLAAIELAEEPDTTVVLTGGRLRPGELSLIGPDAEASFRRYNCDTYVMGVAGVDAKRGLTDYHGEESHVKRTALESADRVVVVVDDSKLGRVQLVNIAPLNAAHTIVTDGAEGHPVLEAARQQGVEVVLC